MSPVWSERNICLRSNCLKSFDSVGSASKPHFLSRKGSNEGVSDWTLPFKYRVVEEFINYEI